MKKNEKQKNRKKRNFMAVAATVLAVSGIGAGVFSMMAEASVQGGLSKVEEIPTSYHVPAAASVPEIPEKVTEVNYHVSMSEMNKEEPTAIDLSMEEAAALGVKYLEEIMDFDAEGADVYMIYNSGTITFPRAFWSGDVRFGEQILTDDDTWSFFIDAVTGELFNIGCTETLDVDVPLGYDTSLETNYGIYAEAAREVAERCNLMNGPVVSVEYGGQGYGSNNPDISVEVNGENGKKAIVTFSRYNQRLLGIITNTSREVTDKALEDLTNKAAETSEIEAETLQFEGTATLRAVEIK